MVMVMTTTKTAVAKMTRTMTAVAAAYCRVEVWCNILGGGDLKVVFFKS